jgi:hypothetical protein
MSGVLSLHSRDDFESSRIVVFNLYFVEYN